MRTMKRHFHPSLRGAAEAIQTKTPFYLDCRASLAMTIIFLFLLSLHPAQAQPVESAPLGPAPYTLKNETDPMALGGPAAPEDGPEAPVFRGEALPPSPPPGTDTIAPAPDFVPMAADAPPATMTAPPRDLPDYPNNEISGLPKEDTTKFEKMTFCTLKISFGSQCCGTDKTAGKEVKEYLDANPDKLTYTRTNWGKEGEYSYCVKVTEHKNRARIYKDLKKMIPSIKGSKGPVTLTGEGFEPVGENKRKVPQMN